MSHKERLLATLQKAISEGGIWMTDWIKEVEAEKIKSNKLYRWLGHHVTYWKAKDRAYGEYVEGLMKTWVALVRGVSVEEV